jgi:hypothetical protein
MGIMGYGRSHLGNMSAGSERQRNVDGQRVARGDDLATVWIRKLRKERRRRESNGEGGMVGTVSTEQLGRELARCFGVLGNYGSISAEAAKIHVDQAAASGPGSGFSHLELGPEAGKAASQGPARPRLLRLGCRGLTALGRALRITRHTPGDVPAHRVTHAALPSLVH